jgi:hypothetical protein
VDICGYEGGREETEENLHNVGRHNLYSSSNTVTVVKPRILKWKGHVARMEKEKIYSICMGNL